MLTKTIKFWSYLTFLIPSFICTLFVLYHLLFDRTLRQALNNHVIIILLLIGLITEATVYPWLLYTYQYQGIWQRAPFLCAIYAFIDWGLYITYTIILAWATIERHILIFHDKWVSTRKKRIFVHYLPLISLLTYCIIFYSVYYFFPPCANIFNSAYASCISPCLGSIYGFSMYTTVVHSILPVLLIVVFSMALLVRVVYQKFRVRQPIQWRKYRKMTIQLLSISFLYLIFYFPYTIVRILVLCGIPSRLFSDFSTYSVYLSYFVNLLFPFVCAVSLPELRTKIKKALCLRRQQRRIGIEVLTKKTPPLTIPVKTH